MNAKEFWTEYTKTAGLPDDLVKAVDQALSNEKVANAFVPRPEFSRALDAKDKEARTAADALQKYQSEVQEYYKTESQKAAERQQKVDEAVAAAQRYRDLYGDLPSDGTQQSRVVATPAFDGSKYISRDDYEKELKRIEGQSLYVIKEGLKASQDYMSKFGKPLDIDALEKFAIEKNLPINLAYQQMIQPELEAKTNSTWEAKLKAAREEGASEALSRVKSPLDTAPRESSPFLANVQDRMQNTAPLSAQERLRNFAEAYTAPTNATKG
jgi:hypothetical protein